MRAGMPCFGSDVRDLVGDLQKGSATSLPNKVVDLQCVRSVSATMSLALQKGLLDFCAWSSLPRVSQLPGAEA